MRRLALLALVVPLVSGCGWFGGSWTGYSPLPASEGLGSEVVHDVPYWVKAEHLPPKAVAGAHLFAVAGCTVCHVYLGSGQSNLGGPNLTAIGTRHLGIAFEIRHLRCPSCVVPGSPMPRFASLGKKRLRQLAIFLEASKGAH